MDINKRDQFIRLWKEYFGDAELPVTFQYSNDNQGSREVEIPDGHRCLVAQLLKVQKGRIPVFHRGVNYLHRRQEIPDV